MNRTTTVAAIAAIVVLGGSGAYASGALSGDELKQNSIDSSELQNSTIRSIDIRDESLTGADVDNGTLTGYDIRDFSLTAADIGANAVDGARIKDNTITGADLRGDTVDWLADEVGKRRGGPGGFVDHSEIANGKIVFNNRVTGDHLVVINARFNVGEPVKVTITDPWGKYTTSCVADPAGFAGPAACTIVMPFGTDFWINSTTADGNEVQDTQRDADGTPGKNLVQSALVKVG